MAAYQILDVKHPQTSYRKALISGSKAGIFAAEGNTLTMKGEPYNDKLVNLSRRMHW